MRVITLHQPFATLMFLKRNGQALKQNETRSWHHQNVKGTIGIAAAAKLPAYAKDLLTQWPFCEDLKGIDLPLGAILGTVEIIGYQTSESWMNQHSHPNMTEAQIWAAEREFRYGDYATKRWIWNTINPVQFDQPIPAKGSQGWWSYPI